METKENILLHFTSASTVQGTIYLSERTPVNVTASVEVKEFFDRKDESKPCSYLMINSQIKIENPASAAMNAFSHEIFQKKLQKALMKELPIAIKKRGPLAMLQKACEICMTGNKKVQWRWDNYDYRSVMVTLSAGQRLWHREKITWKDGQFVLTPEGSGYCKRHNTFVECIQMLQKKAALLCTLNATIEAAQKQTGFAMACFIRNISEGSLAFTIGGRQEAAHLRIVKEKEGFIFDDTAAGFICPKSHAKHSSLKSWLHVLVHKQLTGKWIPLMKEKHIEKTKT
jgi:hypothetical protein